MNKKQEKNSKKHNLKILGVSVSPLTLAIGADVVFAELCYNHMISNKESIGVLIDRKYRNHYNSKYKEKTAYSEYLVKNSESIYILSHDELKLHAYFTPNISHKYLINVHGYGKDARYTGNICKIFHERGFNVISIDLRASGKSEGTKFGMGWFDKNDLITWCKWIAKKDDLAEIVIYGYGLGAITLMTVSSEKELPSNVKCLIEEEGFTSLYDIASFNLKKVFGVFKLPIVKTMEIISYARYNYTFYDVNAINALKKSKLPILFIHSKDNGDIPNEMIDKLYDSSNASYKDKMILSNTSDNEDYHKGLTDFVNKFVNDNIEKG